MRVRPAAPPAFALGRLLLADPLEMELGECLDVLDFGYGIRDNGLCSHECLLEGVIRSREGVASAFEWFGWVQVHKSLFSRVWRPDIGEYLVGTHEVAFAGVVADAVAAGRADL
jgi:hypothetical protein